MSLPRRQSLTKAPSPSTRFIQCLLAQMYDKSGDKDRASEYYRKAAMATSHNPAAAYAVRIAKKKAS
jgi:Tfp pilus assembly protein PilF